YSLFFYSHRDPLALHSFPTRRSSDLVAAVFTQTVAVYVPATLLTTQFGLSLRVQVWAELSGLFRSAAQPSLWPPATRVRLHPVRDRKSTRLNSSHRTISYAVFCLKKK